MPLESLGKGKLNIKGIETPEFKDRPIWEFLEGEMTPKFRTDLVNFVRKSHRGDFELDRVSRVLMLFPDEREAIIDRIPSRRIIYKSLERDRNELQAGHFLRGAYMAKLAYPKDSFRSLGVLPSDERWIRPKLNDDLDNDDLYNFAERVVYARFIFPGFQKDFPLGQEIYEIYMSQLVDYLDEQDQLSVMEYAEEASNLRLLFPEKFTKDVIAGLNWSSMKYFLEKFKEPDADASEIMEYAKLLHRMRILAASSVQLTDHGIEFGNAVPEFKDETPPLPELKK